MKPIRRRHRGAVREVPSIVGFAKRSIPILLVFVSCCISSAEAFVYANNETFNSLPALFGRYISESKFYQVRLQYFHENPYLCEVDDKTRNSFVPPLPITAPGNVTLPNVPIALLVGRGSCSFQQKANMAEKIHPSIEFLVVYNFRSTELDEEDILVPMYSEGFTSLALVSISHNAGQSLKKWLSEQQSEPNTALGGPYIRIDGAPPSDITQANINSMIFSALGLFFMLTSFAGCIVILAGTYSQITNEPNPITSSRLLTTAEIQQLRENHDTCDDPHHHHHRDDQCSVCIDDFADDADITVLPCSHAFHSDCIVPWLTERQSKCPLCKFDVLEHIREQHQESFSVWDRMLLLRRNYHRWTSIQGEDDDGDDDQNNNMFEGVEDDDSDDGILVDQQPPPQHHSTNSSSSAETGLEMTNPHRSIS